MVTTTWRMEVATEMGWKEPGKAPLKEVQTIELSGMFTDGNRALEHEPCQGASFGSQGNPVSQILPLSGGLAGNLWFVCVLVMIAAGGGCCSQTRRSINRAKVRLKFKLKNYNIVFKRTRCCLLWERVRREVR